MNVSTRFFVGWQSRQIGTLEFVQSENRKWTFDYEEGWLLPMTLAPVVRPREIPHSVNGLMAEGFQRDALIGDKPNAMLQLLNRSERFLSNVVIVDNPHKIAALPVDRLEGRLRDYRADGTFCGKMSGVPDMSEGFIQQIRDLIARRTMPVMSGYHAKIPMYLDKDGMLTPADSKPFTHILKLPGTHGDLDYRRSLMEWTSLDIAGAGGLKVAECALVDMNGKVAMLSERFDICTDEDDMRLLFAEDFNAVMGNPAGSEAKYESNTSLVATRLREVSTNFADDSREYLRLVHANLLLENGDFHLKNLSVLKVASPTLDRFTNVRLAPAYDIMATREFLPPNMRLREDQLESMVLPINGKTTDIHVRDLVALAKFMDIDPDEARDILIDQASGMMQRAQDLYLNPPYLVRKDENMVETLRWTCQRLAKRVGSLFPELDCELDPVEPEQSRRPRGSKP